MKKKLLPICLLTFFLASFADAKEDPVNIYPEPRKLPTRYIYHNDGPKTRLTDFAGKFTVAVFWSRTCAPCLSELKDLNNLYNQTKADGLNVILISPASEWKSSVDHAKFLKRYGASDLDSYVDVGGDVMADLGIFSYPLTILINAEGKEYGRIRGKADWDDKDVIEYLYKQKSLSNKPLKK